MQEFKMICRGFGFLVITVLVWIIWGLCILNGLEAKDSAVTLLWGIVVTIGFVLPLTATTFICYEVGKGLTDE